MALGGRIKKNDSLVFSFLKAISKTLNRENREIKITLNQFPITKESNTKSQ